MIYQFDLHTYHYHLKTANYKLYCTSRWVINLLYISRWVMNVLFTSWWVMNPYATGDGVQKKATCITLFIHKYSKNFNAFLYYICFSFKQFIQYKLYILITNQIYSNVIQKLKLYINISLF